MTAPESAPLEFRFGAAGALAPVLLFIAGVAWLSLSGAPDERGFWPVLIAALGLGLALARRPAQYSEAAVRGMAQPLVALMILAWLFAGLLASLLQASGLIDALVAVAQSAGARGGVYVATSFLIACVLSTATGTSLGTLLLAVPLLYPPGIELGAQPAWLLGALLGGATFGDNISPVSDTTIASAATQGATMSAVVRSRLRYAIPPALVALVLYVMLGGSAAAAGGVHEPMPPFDPRAAAMLVVPAAVIALLLLGAELLPALMAGALLASLGGLALGLFSPQQLLHLDRDAFVARGLLLDGLERGVGVSILTLLLMGVTGALEASGLIERAVEAAERRAHSPRAAEGWIFAATSFVVLVMTHSAVAILAVGPLAARLGGQFGIPATRRANVLDVTVCTYPFLLPYFIPTILAASLTRNSGQAPPLTPWSAGLHNLHSWGLLVIIVLAVATGWNRGEAARLSRP